MEEGEINFKKFASFNPNKYNVTAHNILLSYFETIKTGTFTVSKCGFCQQGRIIGKSDCISCFFNCFEDKMDPMFQKRMFEVMKYLYKELKRAEDDKKTIIEQYSHSSFELFL